MDNGNFDEHANYNFAALRGEKEKEESCSSERARTAMIYKWP
jgi:hypothetical protein